VGARPPLIAQHRDRIFAQKIGGLVGVCAADFGERFGRVEFRRLKVRIADFDQGDFTAASHRFHGGVGAAGAGTND
jgi:hypothetical protein